MDAGQGPSGGTVRLRGPMGGGLGRLSCVLDSTTYKVMKHQTYIERRRFLLCATSAQPDRAETRGRAVFVATYAASANAGSGKRIHCSDSPFLAQDFVSCEFASFACASERRPAPAAPPLVKAIDLSSRLELEPSTQAKRARRDHGVHQAAFVRAFWPAGDEAAGFSRA